MSNEWSARLAAGSATVAGVLSGTSGDGIDVVLARFSSQAGLSLEESLAFATLPYEAALSRRVRAVLEGEELDLRRTALLTRDLGRAFGRAARTLAEEHAVELDLVASHGQTVYHHDGEEASGAATLQLGDGDFVAEESGVACASDFRLRDIAAGGEGAPLSALADPVLFRNAPRPLALLNLGGMANLTLLGSAGENVAFDTGPANAWLDGLARRLFDRPFDDAGKLARQGQLDEQFLRQLLDQPFFDRAPPKSTGRDTFGTEQLLAAIERTPGVAAFDRLRTAGIAIARSVAVALERWGLSEPFADWGALRRVHACGGGVHNRTLLEDLASELQCEVTTTTELGVDPDAREALVFAALGAARASGLSLTEPGRPGPTGARGGVVLGKLSAATR